MLNFGDTLLSRYAKVNNIAASHPPLIANSTNSLILPLICRIVLFAPLAINRRAQFEFRHSHRCCGFLLANLVTALPFFPLLVCSFRDSVIAVQAYRRRRNRW